MRRLLPGPEEEVDPRSAYAVARPHTADRPWLLVNMVTSLDGAVAVDGRSGALGGPGDHLVFHALRSLADVILVGAATVRAEGYGPVRIPADLQEARVLAGQAAVPRLAIVSRRLDLDLTSPLFTESDPAPVVVTSPAAAMARRAEVAQTADLLLAGHGDDVDFEIALAALGEMDAELVVCEGGPTINGQLLGADLIDEFCLTVAPKLVGGMAGRPAQSPTAFLHDYQLAHVLEHDGELYLRAVRPREP
jgi:riboflavin biosynthesis pyrimidine reductase